MGDSNDTSATDRKELAQDDPFAELTRIMGHDPRDTSRSEAGEEGAADGLALELENELIGDLAEEPAVNESFARIVEFRNQASDEGPVETAESHFAELNDTHGPDAFDNQSGAITGAADSQKHSLFEGEDGSFVVRDEDFAPFDPDFESHDENAGSPVEPARIAQEAQQDVPSFEQNAPDDFEERESQVDLSRAVFGRSDYFSAAGAEQPSADIYGATPAEDRSASSVDDWGTTEPSAAEPQEKQPSAVTGEFKPEIPIESQAPQDDIADDVAYEYASDDEDQQRLAQESAWFQQTPSAPVHEEFADEEATTGEAEPIAEEQAWFQDSRQPIPPSSEEQQGPAGDWTQPTHLHGWEGEPPAEGPASGTPSAGADEIAFEQELTDWRNEPSFLVKPDREAEAVSQRPSPPEVDTSEVSEENVSPTGDLDVPDVPYHEDVKGGLDEIEELLAGAFGETEPVSGNSAQASREDRTEVPRDGYASVPENDGNHAYAAVAAGATGAYAADAAIQPAQAGEDHYLRNLFTEEDFRDADWHEDGHLATLAPSPGAEPPQPSGRRRSGLLMTTAALGGIVVLGGAAFLALTFSGEDEEGPILVEADKGPVKVKPDDPGGTSIPNQDNQVYRRVSGQTDPDAGQTRLVSTTEEPLEIGTPDTQAGAPDAQANIGSPEKIQERLGIPEENRNAGAADAEPSLQPRLVRSYVVRPDGTMVPHEAPEPPQTVADGNVSPSVDARIDDAAAAGNAQDTELTSAADGSGFVAAGGLPTSAPVPRPRPAQTPTPEQVARNTTPINANQQQTSGNAQQDSAPSQVAAASPNPAPAAVAPSAPSSAWSVQIASQPSVEGAQQSYQSLAQRYGNLLQGRGVNIVKAEIDGRGTYYRVRIPSSSKDDAIELCEQLQAAGGSCFVSQ